MMCKSDVSVINKYTQNNKIATISATQNLKPNKLNPPSIIVIASYNYNHKALLILFFFFFLMEALLILIKQKINPKIYLL
jgi:hypothetical protein